AKLAAEQAKAEKVAAAKLAADQAEAEKVAAAKLAAEQAKVEKVAAAKLAAEQADAEKIAAAKLATDQLSAQNQRAPIAVNRFVAADSEPQEKQEIHLYPHFPSFVATLQESDLEMLDQLVDQLKSQKLARVDVVGHSDNLPIAARSQHVFADNLALSEARARNVAEYLQQQLGVPSEVIILHGLGDSMPTADNTNEAGRALNRRVEISLVSEPVKKTTGLELAKDTSEVLRTDLRPAESGIVVTNVTTHKLAGLINN
ncbi:MAG: OmpA family protein, partial [Desulfuromonadales bacterium]|nr:OmpA family protein [Desulfuromonadales bacterium]